MKRSAQCAGEGDQARANRISVIGNGKRSITADTAARVGRFFGTSPRYWMKIQNQYDLAMADEEAIELEVLPKSA